MAKSAIRLYGTINSHKAWVLRDFLQRSTAKFDWVELANDDDAYRHLGETQLDNINLPVIELPGHGKLFDPSLTEVANRLGYSTTPRLKEYDLAIFGAGPAGLSAGVYAASEGLKTIIIEPHSIGGQAGSSSLIENYLGFPKGLSGVELAERGRQQAVKFGAEFLMMQEGVESSYLGDRVRVCMANGYDMISKTAIFATGVSWRKLELPNEKKFLGSGLYYGAGQSEVLLCMNRPVIVIGGGNSAGQAVMHLAEYASKVTMLVRGPTLAGSMSRYLISRLEAKENVEIVFNSEIRELVGNKCLDSVVIHNSEKNIDAKVDVKCVFACIGGSPNNAWAKKVGIRMDAAGYIRTGNDVLDEDGLPDDWRATHRMPMYLETSCAGTFAVGDVRAGSIKRMVSAAGEGAQAISMVHNFMRNGG